MIDPIPTELNLNNLRDVFSGITHLEAFIFYGTLLGYQREGNILSNDDDVDIFLNAKHREQLLEYLNKTDFEITIYPKYRWYYRTKTPLVIQASRKQNGLATFVDFYLYQDENINYISERWNFGSTWKDETTSLHVPKNLVFPLKQVKMQGITINVPAKTEEICRFLYGANWQIPAEKGKDYISRTINNKPVCIEIPPKSGIILKTVHIIKLIFNYIYYHI
jgi:phosphorylcholine metabolism protein LicD